MTPTLFLLKVGRKLMRGYQLAASQIYRLQFASCGKNFILRSPRIVFGGEYVEIGDDFNCFPGLRLEVYERHLSKRFTPKLTIGNGVSFNYDCHIGCVNAIAIGHGVLMASRVYVSDHSHGTVDYSDLAVPPSDRLVHSKGPVVIEDDVWIGEGACVLPNVRIGRGAIIGANSVVTRDIPPYSIAAGAPCKVIRSFAPP